MPDLDRIHQDLRRLRLELRLLSLALVVAVLLAGGVLPALAVLALVAVGKIVIDRSLTDSPSYDPYVPSDDESSVPPGS